MAKEKLFTPEDFDKPKPKKNKLLKTILLGLGTLCVIGLCIWLIISITSDSDKTTGSEMTSVQTRQESLTTLENIDNPDSISKENLEEVKDPTSEQTNEIEEESIQSSQSPGATSNTVLTSPASDHTISNNVETEALKVIRGIYGNVPERKERLGAQYPAIQARVNEMKRQGIF